MANVTGLHHVTCIAGDPQENVDFYSGVLGMRLVKKSVNQDSPGTYHLFYADGDGHPGTDITFFPWPEMPPPNPVLVWRWKSRSRFRSAASITGLTVSPSTVSRPEKQRSVAAHPRSPLPIRMDCR